MPRFNTTVDDNDPLITYSPTDAWHPGTPETDSYTQYYANDSFTLTSEVGATATFNFYGTGVWLYGARRPNHGSFTVTLDGQTSGMISGSQSDGIRGLGSLGNEFQSVLFSALNLSLGAHQVVLTNQGSQGAAADAIYLDLDYITWESDFGGDGATLSAITLDSSNFQTNGSGWASAIGNPQLNTTSGIFDGTGLSRITGSTISYQGAAVEVYGSVGQTCGLFTVQIDDGISTIYNATTYNNFTDVLIYFGTNFDSGQHTLTMANSVLSNGSLVVDHARVQVVQPGPSSSTSSISSPTSPSRGTSKALIGGLCAALAFLLLLVVALLFWIRRRRRVAIVSRKTSSSGFGAFDIDQPSLPPPEVAMRQASLSDVLRTSMAQSESRSDVSRSTRSRDSPSYSYSHSQGSRSKEDVSRKLKYASDYRQMHDHHIIKVPSSSRLATDALRGHARSGRPPLDLAGSDSSASRPGHIAHSGHKSHRHHRRGNKEKKTKRPLPAVPGVISGNNSNRNARIANTSRVDPLPRATGQPNRRNSMFKGRRSSIRNSRIVRALFAQPGSSNSGSAYAPTTVLTSEISERPATTLSPVTEAPPPPPPSRPQSQSPEPSLLLRIANRADDTLDISQIRHNSQCSLD